MRIARPCQIRAERCNGRVTAGLTRAVAAVGTLNPANGISGIVEIDSIAAPLLEKSRSDLFTENRDAGGRNSKTNLACEAPREDRVQCAHHAIADAPRAAGFRMPQDRSGARQNRIDAVHAVG